GGAAKNPRHPRPPPPPAPAALGHDASFCRAVAGVKIASRVWSPWAAASTATPIVARLTGRGHDDVRAVAGGENAVGVGLVGAERPGLRSARRLAELTVPSHKSAHAFAVREGDEPDLAE